MSDREKKLVLIFGLAAFVLINVFGVSRFRQFRDKVQKDLVAAEKSVATAGDNRDAYDERADELEWMQDHRPEPKMRQTVETELEQYATSQGQAAQLTNVPKGEFMPAVEKGYFHRARVKYNKVTGSEASLYRWLDRLQMPDQLRAVTFLRLEPEAKDDTLIQATVIVEQWFIPESAQPEEEAPPTE
jgi:hypothetical protein